MRNSNPGVKKKIEAVRLCLLQLFQASTNATITLIGPAVWRCVVQEVTRESLALSRDSDMDIYCGKQQMELRHAPVSVSACISCFVTLVEDWLVNSSAATTACMLPPCFQNNARVYSTILTDDPPLVRDAPKQTT